MAALEIEGAKHQKPPYESPRQNYRDGDRREIKVARSKKNLSAMFGSTSTDQERQFPPNDKSILIDLAEKREFYQLIAELSRIIRDPREAEPALRADVGSPCTY